jgi:hypothetical protein
MPAKHGKANRVKKQKPIDSKRDHPTLRKAQPQKHRKQESEPQRGGTSDRLGDGPRTSPRRDQRDLQQELLLAAVTHHNGRLRFPRASAETLATTYAALRSLERNKLIEPEQAGDPEVMTWKITKAGRAAIAAIGEK